MSFLFEDMSVVIDSLVVSVVVPFVFLIIVTLLRWKHYPEKSFKFNLVNVALTPIRFLKLGPFKDGKLSLDKSIEVSMKKTKLSDFGGTEFIENYRKIMEAPFYKAQKVTNLGYISARIELNMTWARRLRFIQYLKENPEVLNVPVRSPVFVMGLPRTGTTFMHRLLSLDPNIRAPLLWELLNPVPGVPSSASAADKEADKKKRYNHVKKLIDTRKAMGDNALDHIHEVNVDLAEECVMALIDDIPINLQFLYCDYMSPKEFYAIDATGAYQHYAKYLKLLSHQEGETKDPRRWVLKCPVHMFYTKEIAKAFPDAKIVWTHRHPISAVPSLCSLLKSVHQIYFEKEGRDDHTLGRNIKEVSADLLMKTPEDLKESGLPCSHVVYNTLVKDPIGTVKQIYAQYNWTFTPEYEKILKDYLEENRKDRERIAAQKHSGAVLHTYEPAEFGLTEEELSVGAYDSYIKKFNVPMSKN